MVSYGIKAKMLMLGAICSVVAGSVGAMSYWYFAMTDDVMREMVINNEALGNHLNGDMKHDALRGDVFFALTASMQQDKAALQEASDSMRGNAADFREMLNANQALDLPNNIKVIIDKVKPALESYITNSADVIQLAGSDTDAALRKLAAFEAAFQKLADEQEVLTELIYRVNSDTQTKGNAMVGTAQTLIVVATTTSLVLILFLSHWLAKQITSPILQAARLAERISEGHLENTLHATSNDETGTLVHALETMNNRLKDIASQVRTSSATITDGAQAISDGNSDLSRRSEQQAESLRDTAASMTQMTVSVKSAAESAKCANDLSMNAREQAIQGGQVVQRAITSMAEISDSSNRIADIISMINEIAFQTNLLALNAAVEAARAGEDGRGFAVVAQEVRSLAQRSATAADEIRSLIEDSVNKISEGFKAVEETGEALQQIQDSVSQVTESVSHINSSSQEQAHGIEQVHQTISQIDSVTRHNLALVSTAASTSESMSAEAKRMSELMQFFKMAS